MINEPNRTGQGASLRFGRSSADPLAALAAIPDRPFCRMSEETTVPETAMPLRRKCLMWTAPEEAPKGSIGAFRAPCNHNDL